MSSTVLCECFFCYWDSMETFSDETGRGSAPQYLHTSQLRQCHPGSGNSLPPQYMQTSPSSRGTGVGGGGTPHFFTIQRTVRPMKGSRATVTPMKIFNSSGERASFSSTMTAINPPSMNNSNSKMSHRKNMAVCCRSAGLLPHTVQTQRL